MIFLASGNQDALMAQVGLSDATPPQPLALTETLTPSVLRYTKATMQTGPGNPHSWRLLFPSFIFPHLNSLASLEKKFEFIKARKDVLEKC